MLIIIDEKMPFVAKEKLSSHGKLIELETSGLTYDGISGHPDIFFCQTSSQLIVAPNLPEKYFEILSREGVKYSKGIKDVGAKYPETAIYNACASEDVLIHNLKITDQSIVQVFDEQKKIHTNQGYCRCNLVYLKNKKYVCSDIGITRTLINRGLEVFYVDPRNIQLHEFQHGFFGGCVGTSNDKFFVNGKLNFLKEKSKLRKFIEPDFEVVELHDGNLIDIGSIFFIEN